MAPSPRGEGWGEGSALNKDIESSEETLLSMGLVIRQLWQYRYMLNSAGGRHRNSQILLSSLLVLGTTNGRHDFIENELCKYV